MSRRVHFQRLNLKQSGLEKEFYMGSVNQLGMGAGAMDMVAGELQQAAGAIEQAIGGLQQNGGGQGQSGVSGYQDGQQGGQQGIQQELSQVEQALSQLTQELGNNQGGGSQPGQGVGGPNGGAQPQGQTFGTPAQGAGNGNQGGGNIAQALGSSGMNSLNNLITDAAHSGPGSWTGDSSHVQADLTGVRNAVQSAADSGQIGEQTAAKALSDIGQGNISAVEQDLTGTPGNLSPEA
jgi:hypothetical protein